MYCCSTCDRVQDHIHRKKYCPFGMSTTGLPPDCTFPELLLHTLCRFPKGGFSSCKIPARCLCSIHSARVCVEPPRHRTCHGGVWIPHHASGQHHSSSSCSKGCIQCSTCEQFHLLHSMLSLRRETAWPDCKAGF